jgi:hypothetical protein
VSAPVLSGGWEGSTVEEVFKDFRNDRWNEPSTPEPYESRVTVLYAYLNSDSYEEQATLVYLDGGQLMCSEAGHCSCNGFEGQFEGTPTTLGALRMMESPDRHQRTSDKGRWFKFLDSLTVTP